jgi:hypothetical protein
MKSMKTSTIFLVAFMGSGVGECLEPAPYLAVDVPKAGQRPLEASGAHSPPATAVSAPSVSKSNNALFSRPVVRALQ